MNRNVVKKEVKGPRLLETGPSSQCVDYGYCLGLSGAVASGGSYRDGVRKIQAEKMPAI